jgi:cytochrome c
VITGGDPERGASSIYRYGCGSCHTIPGIPGAHGLVGPSLSGLGNRMYVAGILPNQPNNVVRWVHDPKSINEKTVMPNLGVTTSDATDITAFLYSLK